MKLPAQSNRRSDEIRRRRTSQSHATKQASKNRRSRIVSPPLPPVMARTPVMGASQTASRKGQKSRRLYNVSLDAAHGSEMSLPALPRLILSWRILSFIIVGLFGYGLYWVWQSPDYRVDAPQISGLARLNSNQIVADLGLTGKPVFLLNAQDVQAQVMKSFPELSDAEVKIELPNTVMITVTERIPVLTWVQNGTSFLVDEQGITFPLRFAGPGADLPVVQAAGSPPTVPQPGVSPTDTETQLRELTLSKITGTLLPQVPVQDEVKPLLKPDMVKAILLVYDQRPAGANLIYDPVHGLGWTDRRGWNVYLGEDTDIDVKLQVYRAIMDTLKSEETRPTMISVEYVHAPYFRLEQVAQANDQ